MSDGKPARRAAAAALGGIVSGVGQSVSDRVRQELAAARAEGDAAPAARVGAAALGGLVGGLGQNVSDLVRDEVRAARSEITDSAKQAARGVGLLGGAAAAGNTAVLFTGIALWRGLGNRIGYARSAVVVAALAGGAAVLLAQNGRDELARVRGARRQDGAPPAENAPAPGSEIVRPTAPPDPDLEIPT
ncbi:phage holin family protein [Amnibacterium sp. CER49]|uniref:phage holin family protein n=1 Tax=Amnibacterium sp. CER49 TaxID=3039161 RepID=UPI002447B26D|nr:phage holin family protein [Amnibacterium sp. CER49]MDH2445164.1 phage holin family protein [Amnibacterium sp. CER49]